MIGSWDRHLYALDAPLVEDLRDAHEVAGRLCERVLGEDPTAQPWVAAAAFVLNAGDGWRGPMYTLAAMEHALTEAHTRCHGAHPPPVSPWQLQDGLYGSWCCAMRGN